MSNYWGINGMIPGISSNPNPPQQNHFSRPPVINLAPPQTFDAQCAECGATFDSKYKLDRHQLKHSEVRNFACSICGKPFKTEANMIKHQKIHDTGPFNCTYCLTLFLRRKERDRHSKFCPSKPEKPPKESKRKEVACDVCQKVFSSNTHLKRHIACVHENRRDFKCEYQDCLRAFNDVNALREHQKIVHLKIRKAQCHLCDAQYPFKSLLIRHIQVAHDDYRNRYSCDLCSRTFPIKAKILKHMRTAHMMIPSGSCVCEFCARVISKNSIAKHVLSVHLKQLPRNFVCEICKTATFTSKDKLESHHYHKHSDARNFVCKLCSRTFKDKAVLIRHQQTHEVGRLQCSYCFETMSNQEEFNTHPDTCTVLNNPPRDRKIEKKEYFCNLCKKQFTRLSGLKNHRITVHENQRNYKCDYYKCMKAFNNSKDLGRHKKLVHNKFRKYCCALENCNAKFAIPSLLEKHKKSHENFGKTFSCDLCKMTFEAKEKLLRHMRFLHLNKNRRNRKKHKVRIENVAELVEPLISENEDEFKIKEEPEDQFYNEITFVASGDCFEPISVKDEPFQHEDFTSNFHPLNQIDIKSEIKEEEEVKKEESEFEDDRNLLENFGNDVNYSTSETSDSDKSEAEDVETKSNQKSYSKKKNLKCSDCDKYYRHQCELDQHKKYVHAGIKEFVCTVEDCQKSFALKKSLKHHERAQHPEEFEKNLSKEEGGPRKNENSFSENFKYTCHICDLNFTRSHELDKHIESKHKDSEAGKSKNTRIICVECGILINKNSLLKHNIRFHNHPVNAVFECDFCGIVKKVRENIVNHMKTNHMPKSRCKFSCETCGTQLADRKALRNHIKFIHEKYIQEICEHCGRGFVDKQRYSNHVRSKHTLEKPFQCPECDKAFSSSSSLRNHRVKGHLRIRQPGSHKRPQNPEFVCAYNGCGVAFRTSNKLKNHQEVHSGERRHVCKLCFASYRNGYDLVKHIRVKHLKFEARCMVENCGAKFIRKSLLKDHILKKHNHLSGSEVDYYFKKIEEIPLPSLQSYNDAQPVHNIKQETSN